MISLVWDNGTSFICLPFEPLWDLSLFSDVMICPSILSGNFISIFTIFSFIVLFFILKLVMIDS